MKMTSIFKKASIFAAAITLALLMVVSVLPAVFAAEAPTEKLVASNITLSGDISMMYYFTGLEDFDEDDYIQITVPKQGSEDVTKTKIPFSKISTDDKGRWVVKVPVAYAQQTDIITMQWFKDGVGGKVRTRTVKDYADKVLDLAANGDEAQKEAYAPAVAPVVNMLNTGAMAQIVNKHNVDNLANKDLFPAGNPVDNMLDEHFYDVPDTVHTDANEAVDFVGGQVFLTSKIQLRIYLTCPDNITTATVSKDGAEAKTVVIKSDEYGKYVGINNIVASSFDVPYTVTVGGEAFTYSVLNYAQDTVNSSLASPAQKDTAKAIYLFYSYSKAYATKDSDAPYVPGPKNEAGESICTHTRSYVRGTEIVCSDCGKVVEGASVKLSVSADPTKIVAGAETEVKFTFAIGGNADLTGIVFTPKCDDEKVTLSEPQKLEYEEGYVVDFSLNGVVLSKEANEPIKAGTFATVTYKVKATEAGNYNIYLLVRQATTVDAEGKPVLADLSCISAGNVVLEVAPAPCDTHTNLVIKNAGEKHIKYCPDCYYTETADHSFASTYEDINGVRYYNSKVCTVCNAYAVDNVKSNFKLGFTVDAEGNETEKAPLLVFTPGDMAKMGVTRVTKVGAAADGSYYTFAGNQSGKEGYINVFSGKDNPYGVTGQYLMIKYRTTCGTKMQIFYGANNGKTGAFGGDNFYLTTGNNSLVANGEWQTLIINLNGINSTYFKAETKGENTGKFMADYIRWDIFDTNPADQQPTVDVAYIAMSDDIMSLASFGDNDFYTICNKSVISGEIAVASGSHMASAKTQNVAFDGGWIATGTLNLGETVVGSTKLENHADSTHNGLPYVGAVSAKTDSTCTDNYVYIMGSKNANAGTAAPIDKNTKYVVVMYRKYVASRFQWYIRSSGTNATGSGDTITIAQGDVKADGKWHFSISDISKLTAVTPANGITVLRFDYHDAKPGTEGSKLTDIAFVAFFTSEEEAYEYMNEYVDKYLNAEGGQGCMHDVTYKDAECTTFCKICGEKVKENDHASSEWYSVAHDPQHEYIDCTDCGKEKVGSRLVDTTLKGLTIFTPEELLAKGVGNATEEVLTENGLTFMRATATTGKEGTLYLSQGGTNKITNCGKYLAVMIRKNGGPITTFEAYLNAAGTTGATNSRSGSYKVPTDGTWHLYILNADKLEATEYGWTRLDVINGNGHNVGDTVDIAWAGFFASTTDANEMFWAYLNAYVDCAHDNQSKLENITNIEVEGSVFTATADCNACGKKGVSVTLETPDNLPIFTPGKFISISAAASTNMASGKIVTNDASVNNMPYVRYTKLYDPASSNELYFTLGSGTWGPVGKYFAILYRRSTLNPETAVNDTFQFLQGKAGTTTSSDFTTTTTSASAPDGEWKIVIVELKDTHLIDGKLGWTRLDIFNGSKTGAILDIAYAGFFTTKESANEYYAAYISQYLGAKYCPHTFSTTSEIVEGDLTDTLNTICSACKTTLETQEISSNRLAVLGADVLKNHISLEEGVSGGGYYGNITTGSDAFYNGLPYVRVTATKVTGGSESFIYFKFADPIEEVGDYVSVIYRSHGFTPTTMYARATAGSMQNGTQGSTSVGPAAVSASNGGWNQRVYDASGANHTAWDASTGVGAIRLAYTKASVTLGNGIDIAYVGFFNSLEEANAFYAEFCEYYNATTPVIESPTRIHYNGVSVNGTKITAATDAINNSFIYDFSAQTLNDANSLSVDGWFIVNKGVENYEYRIIGENGEVKTVSKTATYMADDALSGMASGAGLVVDGDNSCRPGAKFGTVNFDLSDFAGQTVTIEFYANTKGGDHYLISTFVNVVVPAPAAE